MYREILTLDGSLRIKHDNPEFFQWSLEQLVADKWRITELAFDLHDSSLADDYKFYTEYERRWLSEGRTTHYVTARPMTKHE
jgi:tRNA (guanine-N7-)-methyltransferase